MKLIKKAKARYSEKEAFQLSVSLLKRLLIGFLILFSLKLFGFNLKLIVFLLIAIIFNSLLSDFQLRRGLPTDFELSTFSTILITIAFGLKWGIIIAIFSKLIASIYTGNLLADHFFMILTYINASILAYLFKGMNILTIGLTIVVINNIIMFFISKHILGIDITANLSYTVTNFIFNLLTFLIFGELVFGILT